MTTAQDLFELVDDLRSHVEEAAASPKWINDEQFAKSYKQLALEAGAAFGSDPVIGELQVSIPPEIDALIHRDPSCLTTWLRMQLGRLAIRLAQHARRTQATETEIADLDLSFMEDGELRNVVSHDFAEAQQSYYSDSPKAAAILCGSVIEGMLLDVLRRSEVEEDERFAAFLNKKNLSKMNWDYTSLSTPLQLAASLDRIRPTTAKLADGVRDFRNTVHPAVEVRSESRAGEQDERCLDSDCSAPRP